MTTRTEYQDIDYTDALSDTEVSDFTAGWAACLFWLGVLLLATPLWFISIVAIPMGAVIWLCRPALRKAEADMSETARTEGASVRSGCALLWVWLVGIAVVGFALLVALGVLASVVSMGGGW